MSVHGYRIPDSEQLNAITAALGDCNSELLKTARARRLAESHGMLAGVLAVFNGMDTQFSTCRCLLYALHASLAIRGYRMAAAGEPVCEIEDLARDSYRRAIVLCDEYLDAAGEMHEKACNGTGLRFVYEMSRLIQEVTDCD